MTNKIIGLLALCVIALAFVAYTLWHEEEKVGDGTAELVAVQQEPVKENKESPIVDAVIPEVKSDTGTLADTANLDAEKSQDDSSNKDQELCRVANRYSDWYPKGDSYESDTFIAEVRAWASARGYFETEYSEGSLGVKKRSDYDYYEIEDLEEMARAGDSMANVRLAYRLYLKGDVDSLESAQPYCERAIVDGYTALIMCKSSYLVGKINMEKRKGKEGKDINEEFQRSLELEYRGWQGVAEELGDGFGAELTINMLPNSEFEFESHVIAEKNAELIKNIKSRRSQLGIEELNYPPVPELLEYLFENPENVQEKINACFE